MGVSAVMASNKLSSFGLGIICVELTIANGNSDTWLSGCECYITVIVTPLAYLLNPSIKNVLWKVNRCEV